MQKKSNKLYYHIGVYKSPKHLFDIRQQLKQLTNMTKNVTPDGA